MPDLTTELNTLHDALQNALDAATARVMDLETQLANEQAKSPAVPDAARQLVLELVAADERLDPTKQSAHVSERAALMADGLRKLKTLLTSV
jgi:hypothetical protein